MAARRKASSPTPAIMTFVALAIGVAGGYVWRSYAPLPIPGETPLSADYAAPAASIKAPPPVKKPADPKPDKATLARAEKAEEEVRRLQKALERLEYRQTKSEETLADLQIREILGGEGE